MSHSGLPLSRALLALLLLPWIGVAAPASDPPIDFSVTAEDGPVLVFEEQPGELVVSHPPRTTVFADGRLLVERPPRMKNAGRFDLQLSDSELRSLIDLALAALTQRPPLSAPARGAGVRIESDPTVQRFTLRLERTRRGTQGWRPLEASLELADVTSRARREPELATLGTLVEELHAWSTRAVELAAEEGR